MTVFNDKQAEILKAAEKLFAEEGFDGTSIRNIAKAANVNIAMISYYFGSKEKLLEALIIFRTSDLRLQLESIFNEDSSPAEKVDRFIDLYITRMNKNRSVYQIVHFELSSKKRLMDIKAFSEVKKKNIESFRKIVEEGQQQGIFRKNVNATLIPLTIMGAFFHFHMNRPFFEDILHLETDEDYNDYIKNELTSHIKQTIKALLVHEN